MKTKLPTDGQTAGRIAGMRVFLKATASWVAPYALNHLIARPIIRKTSPHNPQIMYGAKPARGKAAIICDTRPKLLAALVALNLAHTKMPAPTVANAVAVPPPPHGARLANAVGVPMGGVAPQAAGPFLWRKSVLKCVRRVSQRPAHGFNHWMRRVDERLDNCPGYYAVIQHPQDMGSIIGRIERGEYGDPSDVDRDMVQMFENVRIYSPDTTCFIHKQSIELQRLWEDEYGPVKASFAAHMG